jgi:catechol 2,3-dioxygenase-like lactoylglutathione lyase family enzyme
MAEISGVDFVTLLVSDLALSYDFYKEKLGLTESTEKRPNARAFSMKPTGLAIRQASDGLRMQNPGQGIILRSAPAARPP